MMELWSKIELKLRIGIFVFLGGFLTLLLGQMIISIPIFAILGFIFSIFGSIVAIIGCISMIAYWIDWYDTNTN